MTDAFRNIKSGMHICFSEYIFRINAIMVNERKVDTSYRAKGVPECKIWKDSEPLMWVLEEQWKEKRNSEHLKKTAPEEMTSSEAERHQKQKVIRSRKSSEAKDARGGSRVGKIIVHPEFVVSFKAPLDVKANVCSNESKKDGSEHSTVNNSKKISRDDFMRKLRLIVGANLMKYAIYNNIHFQTPRAGRSNTSNI
ncbi:RCD1-SRO-TAF4 (RST) plant domain protein [Medicago truncatula]|uniref:RCD1-SRO-TAF4 (RST) plant domain protein n=1 Tax=Medicago truncatula TaxID=3880 RepID=A0A072VCA2_MEDTR|nr:RCD1-SRO-TAF4 (RST) plant domain protein [Medicago truncatula]